MNRSQAATLLGVEVNATPEQARKAFLARARLLHPDRLGPHATPEELKVANEAMAQLNQAAKVMGQPNTSSTSDNYSPPSQSDYTFPVWSEPSTACEVCGWGPAVQKKFFAVKGMVIFFGWSTFESRMCRICAESIYNEAQRTTLLRGWWGIFSFVATVFALIRNFASSRGLSSMRPPQGRFPSAYTVTPVPLTGSRPWWSRPGPWVTTIIALTIAGFIGLIAIDEAMRTNTPGGSTKTNPVSQENNSGYVGSCWAETGPTSLSEVSCSDATAAWVVSYEELAYSTPEQSRCLSDSYMPYDWDSSGLTRWDLCLNALN